MASRDVVAAVWRAVLALLLLVLATLGGCDLPTAGPSTPQAAAPAVTSAAAPATITTPTAGPTAAALATMPPTATLVPAPTLPAARTTTSQTAPSNASPPASGATCAAGVDLLGFSDALDKARFDDTAVGGLSVLTFDPARGVFLALVDNERDTPARLYTLRLPLAGGALGRPEIVGVTRVRDAAGRPLTGRTLDGEGLALLPSGDFLVSFETEPTLRRFAPDGQLLAELPTPPRFLVKPRGEATANMTFEGLALSPDGRVAFVAMEGPLAPDGWTNDGRARLRLLRHEDRGAAGFTPTAHYFYLTEPGQAVSELAALGSGATLVHVR